jgi:hypothetical protein
MFEFNLRVACGWTRHEGEKHVSWKDELGDAKRRKEEEAKRKADSLQWASSVTPTMTHRLIKRLKSDAEDLATKLNAKVTVHLDGQKLQIVHNTFPTFFLQVDVPARGLAYSSPVIGCTINTKKSASSSPKENNIQIPVHCVGPDECYYQIDENDTATEEQTSEFILKPLFAVLAA